MSSLWIRVSLIIVLSSPNAQAATTLVGFNGDLTDLAGNPATGEHDMSFRVYDAASGGTLLAEDVEIPVTVDAGGRFSTAFNLPTDAIRGVAATYLEVEIDDETLSRMQLTA